MGIPQWESLYTGLGSGLEILVLGVDLPLRNVYELEVCLIPGKMDSGNCSPCSVGVKCSALLRIGLLWCQNMDLVA